MDQLQERENALRVILRVGENRTLTRNDLLRVAGAGLALLNPSGTFAFRLVEWHLITATKCPGSEQRAAEEAII